MQPFDIILLALSGLLAGAINSVAGGGTFFTFSALLTVGLPPIVANATSSIAVGPGSVASALRLHTRGQEPHPQDFGFRHGERPR